MVNWILPNLGTAAAGGSSEQEDVHVVDVRDLVDKPGNDVGIVRTKIDEGVRALKAGKTVVICCDHGISRSNAIAAGVLASYRATGLEPAVRDVLAAYSLAEIKIEVLQAVREAIESAPDVRPSTGARGEVVLLTGSTGAVGPEIARALQNGATKLICPTRQEVDLIAGAVQLDLLAVASGATCIAHFADPRVVASNRSLGESLTMLRNVLEVCKLRNLRLVFPSGWEVYSGYRGALVADEDLPRLPKNVHGEAKYLAELLVEHYCQHHRLRGCILRSGPIYGRGVGKPRFLYDFIKRAVNNEDIYTHRYLNGEPGLDLVAVDDYARFAAAAILRGMEGVYHIGSGGTVTTREIAAYIVEVVESRSALKLRMVNDVTASIAMDATRAKSKLQVEASTPWREGIGLVIEEVSEWMTQRARSL